MGTTLPNLKPTGSPRARNAAFLTLLLPSCDPHPGPWLSFRASTSSEFGRRPSDCLTHVIRLLLNLISVSVELIPLFFERIDPLIKLIQRTGCGLEFTIQRLQRLSFINRENICISFPVAELGRRGWNAKYQTYSLRYSSRFSSPREALLHVSLRCSSGTRFESD